ncbi:MAG TPA: hypothetical protein VGN97_21875 [Mesorhizobium sp.]|jgi:hypothetical protein|nr:hypothetical protein [Mesorhizobium sp.]
MTDQTGPADTSLAPKQTTIQIDAVAGYFQRRMVAAENECLVLASQVRDLGLVITQQRDLIAQLSAEVERLGQAPKPGRKAKPPAEETVQ